MTTPPTDTKADMQAALDALGAEYPPNATKAVLARLLRAAQARPQSDPTPVGQAAEHALDAAKAAPASTWPPPTEPKNPAMHDAIAHMTTTVPPDVEAEIAAAREAETAALVPVEGPVAQAFGAWGQISAMAHELSRSSLVKSALRGKPADIALTLLVGRDLGLAPTMALAKIHVIEGLPTLSAEAMAALIRGRGHHLSGVVERNEHGHPVSAVVSGERADTHERMTVDYHVNDAVAAGLCRIDPSCANGVSARRNGNPQSWEKFTGDMLWARAVSQLARRLYPDVLLGVSYTPEELGYVDNEDDTAPDPDAEFVAGGWESRAASVQAHRELQPKIKELPDVLSGGVRLHGWPIKQRAAFDAVRHATEQVLAADGDLTHDAAVAAFGEDAWVAHCRDRIEDADVVQEAALDVGTGDEADGPACATCGSLDPCECPL